MSERTANTQQRILLAITVFIRQNGYSPSLRDLQAACAISSVSIVSYHLRRLRAAGLIDYVDGTPRTIRLVRKGAA